MYSAIYLVYVCAEAGILTQVAIRGLSRKIRYTLQTAAERGKEEKAEEGEVRAYMCVCVSARAHIVFT